MNLASVPENPTDKSGKTNAEHLSKVGNQILNPKKRAGKTNLVSEIHPLVTKINTVLIRLNYNKSLRDG